MEFKIFLVEALRCCALVPLWSDFLNTFTKSSKSYFLVSVRSIEFDSNKNLQAKSRCLYLASEKGTFFVKNGCLTRDRIILGIGPPNAFLFSGAFKGTASLRRENISSISSMSSVLTTIIESVRPSKNEETVG